jgi:2-polyprenyl-3-methyl-5-hydroxy-6-metoxy-1,4-benzoquinol methylase
MDLTEAKRIAQEVVNQHAEARQRKLCLYDDVDETEYGYVFSCNTDAAVRENNPEEILIDIGPFIVNKATGEVHHIPAGVSVEKSLREYEKKIGFRRDRPMPDFGFKLMSSFFKLRDIFRPRLDVLKEAGIKPGDRVLDFGCGPGCYIVPLAELVGPMGDIYALDIHPLAIDEVRKIASKKGLINVKTIQSDCSTGLPDGSLDVILLYDIFHDLNQPEKVLQELHRVLNPGGILSFSDHHLKESEIISRLTGSGLFKFASRGKVYTFSREGR